MTQIESALVDKEDYYRLIIKRINNILLVVMIIFAAWYCLPSNQQLRGRDICSYTAIRLNESCSCSTPAATRTFLWNGSTEVMKVIQRIDSIPIINLTNVTIRYP
jgi:hypothetical protein